MPSTERTPLLQPLQPPNGHNGHNSHHDHNNRGNGQALAHYENVAKTETTERSQTNKLWSFLSSPEQRILFAGFLVSLILGLTQVPIIYLFRVMSCEAFYAHEDQHSHDFDMAVAAAASTTADRCARREIDAATAQQVSIVGMTTSVCGIINLFICGSLIRKLGPRWALVSQTSLLAVRVAIQILGVRVGGRMGIVTVQVAQVVGIVGGPRGYMLVLNTSVAEVVERRKHTGVFGKLQGAIMIGTAVGYLLGGVLGDVFGIASPFEFAVGGFLASTIYAALFMPETDSQDNGSVAEANRNKAPTGFLAPIKILMPPKFRLESGRVVKHYGLAILAFGVFFGVFATGYAPILIQMYATSRFNFATTENGILMSGNSLIRGVFLMFIFPHLIDAGRRWFAKSSTPTHAHFDHEQERLIQESGEVLPANPDEVEPVPGLMNAEEPTKPHPEEEDEDSTFDLFFLRWSLVVDGVVTSISAWATQGWHMYLGEFFPVPSRCF